MYSLIDHYMDVLDVTSVFYIYYLYPNIHGDWTIIAELQGDIK